MRYFLYPFLLLTSLWSWSQNEGDYSWVNPGAEKVVSELTFVSRKDPHLDPLSFTYLDGLVEVLKEQKSLTLKITVWTNSKGRRKKNETLSERRADIICWYLIGAGISPDRLSSEGNGESKTGSVLLQVN
jgi:outer membrane protein OmpA-like peptidoglycan-associated protein